MGDKLKIVAGIPAYNEESSIAKVIVHTARHVDSIVVIDDGSTDDTAAIAQKLGVALVKHESNLGKGEALRKCFSWAKSVGADALVTLDADGQHDPDEIPKLVSPILEGSTDIVIGGRHERPISMPKHRRAGQKVIDHLAGVKADGKLVDTQSGFRAYSKKAIEAMDFAESGMGAETEILMRASNAGLTINTVPVTMEYSENRRSKTNPLIQFTDVISAVAKEVVGRRPLRFLGIPGLLLIAFGIYGWLEVLETYNQTAQFAIGHALVYTTIFFTGIFATIGAIVLFVIRLMLQETRAGERLRKDTA